VKGARATGDHGTTTNCGAVKVREIVRLIEDDGWDQVRQRGSHRQFNGRIRLSEPPLEWIRAALAQERTAGLPVEAEIATAAALLPPDQLHGDPADRVIYATARAHDARLITKDGALRAYDPRGTLW
jgi:predicted nucleic acid-binding protein